MTDLKTELADVKASAADTLAKVNSLLDNHFKGATRGNTTLPQSNDVTTDIDETLKNLEYAVRAMKGVQKIAHAIKGPEPKLF